VHRFINVGECGEVIDRIAAGHCFVQGADIECIADNHRVTFPEPWRLGPAINDDLMAGFAQRIGYVAT
jgi:hypothetical protein